MNSTEMAAQTVVTFNGHLMVVLRPANSRGRVYLSAVRESQWALPQEDFFPADQLEIASDDDRRKVCGCGRGTAPHFVGGDEN